MLKLNRTLMLPLLLISLSACGQPPIPPSAAVDAAPAGAVPAARADFIRKQLKPLCGSPTRWTADQRKTVADFIEKTAADPAQQLEAAELDRLARQVQVCRGGKPTTS